jgi:hypothetical protein
MERRAGGNFRIANMLENAAIARKPRASSRLVIDRWFEGAGRDVFGHLWPQIARGKDVEDQPFPDVGARTASRLRAMLTGDRKPHLHSVNFLVPTADGDMLRYQYERLVLPWKGLCGEDYLVSWVLYKKSHVCRSEGVRPRLQWPSESVTDGSLPSPLRQESQ